MNNNNNKNAHHSGNEYSLFVGDLPHDCTDESLQRLFQSKFKSVRRVQIIRNEDGSSRGFGFIRFEDQTDFQSALSQEMKINGVTLRLDAAHRHKNHRGRYNSFNSTVSNSSNHHNHHHFNNSNSNLHHHHHHNQSHHHPHTHHHPHPQHRHQHGSQQNQTGGVSNKTLLSDHAPGTQHHGQQQGHNQISGRNNTNSNNGNNNNSSNSSNPSQPNLSGSGQQQSSTQQHHNSHLGHSLYNSNSQKHNVPHQPGPNSKQDSKQASSSLSGDDAVKSPNQSQTSSQTSAILAQTPQQPIVPNPQTQHSLAQVPSENIVTQVAGVSISAPTTTSATSTMPITGVNHVAAAGMHNNQQNLGTTHQQALGPEFRGYVAPTLMDSHLLGATEPPSVGPPTSVYSHMYPYGPPFGYMPPPPQPNPVMPISAVPPAPPNQAPSAGAVGQQHTLAPAAVSANRFNPSAQQHHHSQIHHQPAHHHQPQPTHVGAGVDTSGLGVMPGGLPQAPHQGPFYYYYPPLYFDQSGSATGAPPNHLYHPSTFHPQFFAVPGPAYLPNSHGFNQHQPQPPTVSQSDATLLSQPQQQTQPTAQQSHQPTQQQQAKDR